MVGNQEVFCDNGLVNSKEGFILYVHFDVYLQPLVEELQQLWKGVLAYDVVKPLSSRSFTLRCVQLWTIHDFLGYGIVAKVAH